MDPINQQIAERVMGWKLDRKSYCYSYKVAQDHERLITREDWNPTTDPADAMAVLKRCVDKRTKEGWNQYRDAVLCIYAPHEDVGQNWIVSSDPEHSVMAEAETLEAAICAFALKIFP